MCVRNRHMRNTEFHSFPQQCYSPVLGGLTICGSTLADGLSIVNACDSSPIVRH